MRPLSRFVVVPLLSALVILFAPGAATAAPTRAATHRLVLLPGLATAYSGDSDRYVAYGDGYGRTLRLWDSQSGRTWDRRLPRGCRADPMVSGDLVLVPCDHQTSRLINVVTGTVVSIPDGPNVAYGWDAMGHVWLRAAITCPGTSDQTCVEYRSLITGATVVRPSQVPSGGLADDLTNLDDPNLDDRRYCGPVGAGTLAPRSQDLAFGDHVLVRTGGRMGGRIGLRTCGDPEVNVIGGLVDGPVRWAGTLTAGWATWTEHTAGQRSCLRDAAFAYDAERATGFRWRLPKTGGLLCPDTAYHTRFAIFVPMLVHVPPSASNDIGISYRLVAAPLPRT